MFFAVAFWVSLAGAVPAGEAKVETDSSHAVAIKDGVMVFEKPDVMANALRLLYAGEIVQVDEWFFDPRQSRWAKIKMGEAFGYVQAANLQHGDIASIKPWRPSVILRDEKPLAFSLRSGAEMFGVGMNLHYLPFSRLGLTFSVASNIDAYEMKGTSLTFGVVSYLAPSNFSPFIETGFSRLSYHQDYSTLRVDAYFLSLGVEWIFGSGFFINAMVSYSRSTDVEVSFDYPYAKAGHTDVPEYFGNLDPGSDNTFQFFLPGVSLGYAF